MPAILQGGTNFVLPNTAIIHQIATNPNVLAGPDLRSIQGDGLHLLSAGSISDGADRWWMALSAAFYGTGHTAAANVRSGTDRGDGVDGTLVVPVAADVRSGTVFDNGTVGTLVGGAQVLFVI